MKDTIEFFRTRRRWYEIEKKNLWKVFLLLFGLAPTIILILKFVESEIRIPLSYVISIFLIILVFYIGWVSFVEKIRVI